MNIDEFLRIFTVRAPNLMWLLGAGASASAGILTASSLIWQFKRTLFCTRQRISVKSCEDLSNLTIRQGLQRYFDTQGTFPPENSPEEYAAYFEATYPDPADRRAVLESYMAGAKPSYGHLVLAALMKMGKIRIVWTPNFDRVVEDAAVQMLGSTSRFVTATLDNPQTALQSLNEGRWLLIGKMHGDFQSRRLKNTSQELQSQDFEIRRAFTESCRRYGLIVVGYSGRDESIMAALEEAIDGGHGYPGGLFWFQRPDSPLFPAVADLLEKATKAGVQAELLEVQTFDELLGDIIKQFEKVPPDIATILDRHGSRLTGIPPVPPGRGWPVIRLNALPVTIWPTMCRRVVCSIGGTKEVLDAIAKQKARIIGARARVGVLAFGSDTEIRKAFSPFHITDFDCHVIEPNRLGFESAELGLLRDALAQAFQANRPFVAERVRSAHILQLDFNRASAAELAPLKECTGQLAGTIPKTSVEWSEALKIKLDYQLGRLWLLVEPMIYRGNAVDSEQRRAANDFIRERLATRYNRQWNSLIEAWLILLMGQRPEIQLRAFGIDDGIDASFTLTRITAFSRRNGSR
jgi:NAD-dependent SIR2 family protein deacetylase